ncbi:MAG: alkaline phosphatase [Deltaproteobacteria bacterium]|nr:alkaline phosphatase [Deltaproteobacteria bacterium]
MSLFRAPLAVSRLRLGATAALAFGLAGFSGVAGSGLPNTVELPAYRFIAPARPILGPALAERVVLVVVDGLGADHFSEIMVPGALREALKRGAYFTSTVEPPSWSRTQYATLGTGAGVLVHGIASNAQKRELTVDTIFARAGDAGIARILYKPKIEWWLEQFGSAVGEHTPELRIALAALRREKRALAVFHFLAVDDKGHDHGAASRVYRAAIADTGRRIEEIVRALDLSRDLLLITADHGHTDRGGHGGDEREVTRTPVVLVGANVRPGDHGDSQPHDVAPTLALALGVEPPRASVGRPLTSAFQLGDEDRARRNAAADEGVKAFVETWARELGVTLQPDRSVPAMMGAVRARLEVWADANILSRLAVALPFIVVFALLLDPRRLFAGAAVGIGILGAVVAVLTLAVSGLPATFSAVRERGDFIVVGVLISTIVVGTQSGAWWVLNRRADLAARQRSLLSLGTASVFFAAMAVAAAYIVQGFSIAIVYPAPTIIFSSLLALSLASGVSVLWGVALAIVAIRGYAIPSRGAIAAEQSTGQTA